MKIRGVINNRSGTCIDQDVDAFIGKIAAAFTGAGHDCEIEAVDPDQVEKSIRRLVSERPDVLLVGGGDGTIRTGAVAVVGTSIALAVMPLGTMNRFARDLRIPLEPEVAAHALASGQEALVDVAELNGELFLCNSMIGLPPRFSARRSALRGQGLLDRAKGYLNVARDFFVSSRKISLMIDHGGAKRRVRALSVIVSNNTYGDDISPMVLRSSLSDGVLGVYVFRHASGAGLAMAFVRAMLGRWKQDPNLDYARAHDVRIESYWKTVRVSNDGEVRSFSSPLTYRIRPLALRVIRPTDDNLQIVKPVPAQDQSQLALGAVI